MLNEKKVVPKVRQEVKVKFDIVTSDDIKIYYTGKFHDYTARYIINDNFLAKARKLSILTTSLDIFYIGSATLSAYSLFVPWLERGRNNMWKT